MNMTRLVLLIPALVTMLAVAYLAPISGEENPAVEIPVDDLYGRKWILVSVVIDGENVPIIDQSIISLWFDEDKLIGSGGCNDFSADYVLNGLYQWLSRHDPAQEEELIGTGGNITIRPIGVAEIGCCFTDIVGQEVQFLSALNQVTGFELSLDTLKLLDESNQTVLTFQHYRTMMQ